MFKKVFVPALAMLLFTVSSASAEVAGNVIGLRPDGFALRAGSEISLTLKDVVENTDVLRTGEKGRLEVLFLDDSFIKLGANTTLEVLEFVPNPADPRFQTNLTEGVARFITGEIAASRPERFVINTPAATIGVRGTGFTVYADGSSTTADVTSGSITMNGFEVGAGFRGVVSGFGPPQITPLTPGQAQAATMGGDAGGSEAADGALGALAGLGTGGTLTDVLANHGNRNADLMANDIGNSTAMLCGLLDDFSGGKGKFSALFNLQSGVLHNGVASGIFDGKVLNAHGGTGGWDVTAEGAYLVLGNFKGTFGGAGLTYGGLWLAHDSGVRKQNLGDTLNMGAFGFESAAGIASGSATGIITDTENYNLQAPASPM